MVIAVIADIHGNFEALKAVIADASQHNIDALFFLGDFVGWGPQPNECLFLVQEIQKKIPVYAVAGNHDYAVVRKIDYAHYQYIVLQDIEWNQQHIKSDNLHFLESLSETLSVNFACSYFLVHGSPSSPFEEYVITKTHIQWAVEECTENSNVLILGHTHIPFVFLDNAIYSEEGQYAFNCDTSICLNPGSVGFPRDGNWNASYAIMNELQKTITLRRIEYNIDKTLNIMKKKGFPISFMQRLKYGR